jgi:phage protein D
MAILERDPFAPRFEIVINRSIQLTDEMKAFISEVKVEDDADLFDKIEITMDTLNTTTTGAIQEIIDSKLFMPGNLLEVKMGYGNSLKTVGAGYIVKPIPSFSPTGPTLKVIAYDPFFNMSQKKSLKGRSFKNFRDSQCVTIIAAEHAFDYSQVRKADGIFDRFQNVGENDYEFLKRIADLRNFEFYNKYDPETGKFVLFFEPATDRQKEVFTFTYFDGDKNPDSTLLEFDPEMSAVDQATSFKIIGWDRKAKKKIESVFSASDLSSAPQIKAEGKDLDKKIGPKDNLNGRKVRFKAFGENFEVISRKPFKNEKEAKAFIDAWIKKRKDHFITGRGKIIGLEVMQARQKHILNGLGNIFSGKYFFINVTHVMGRGQQYMIEFSVRKVFND